MHRVNTDSSLSVTWFILFCTSTESAFQVWESVYSSVVVLEQRILRNFNFVFLLDNKIIDLLSFSQASCSLNAFITTRNSLSVAT